MSAGLKPCPFCGGGATVAEWPDDGSRYVRCGNGECATAPFTDGYGTEAEAAAAWNARAEGGRVAELEADNRRLRASLFAVESAAGSDMPAVAIDWDDATDKRRREWSQHVYEHALRQDARVAELESLARDMWRSLATASETWAEDEYADRMAELGIEVEGEGEE